WAYTCVDTNAAWFGCIHPGFCSQFWGPSYNLASSDPIYSTGFYPTWCTSIGPESKFQYQPIPDSNVPISVSRTQDDSACDPTRAQTAHTGGMVVVMADASSRTLAVSVSKLTWWQL